MDATERSEAMCSLWNHVASKRNRILPTAPQWGCRYPEVDSDGLYHLIPADIDSPRLHFQASVSLLIFQQRQSEGVKGWFFPVIGITFHIGNLLFLTVRSSSSLSSYYTLVRVLCKIKVCLVFFFPSAWRVGFNLWWLVMSTVLYVYSCSILHMDPTDM